MKQIGNKAMQIYEMALKSPCKTGIIVSYFDNPGKGHETSNKYKYLHFCTSELRETMGFFVI